MSDTDSKLTGWISVCHSVPPCQPLSAQPVRPFYKRQERHRRDRVCSVIEKEKGQKQLDNERDVVEVGSDMISKIVVKVEAKD